MKLAKRPFHLAWFISKGYGPKAWRLPWRGPNPSSWIKPDLLVALAQALERAAFDNVMIEDSSNPNLLIADEPTTALDVTVQARVMDLIDRIRREFDIAVLFISHNLELVAEIADRMTVMYAGRAVESGGVEALFATPNHPRTRPLIRCIPRLDGAVGPMPTIPGLTEPLPPGCPFAPRCEVADERRGIEEPPMRWRGEHMAACFRAPASQVVS